MDAFLQSSWDELYEFFAQGSPPLAVQILIINTIFFMLWMVRRLRGASTLRRETAIAVEVILILANAFILFRRDLLG